MTPNTDAPNADAPDDADNYSDNPPDSAYDDCDCHKSIHLSLRNFNLKIAPNTKNNERTWPPTLMPPTLIPPMMMTMILIILML